MPTFRLSALDQRVPLALLALALLLKTMVPAGWMPSFEDGGVRLILCSGWQPAKPQPAVAPAARHGGHHAMAAAPSHGSGHGDDGDRQDDTQHPCTFAGAALPWLGAADPAPDLAAFLPREAHASFPLLVGVGRGLAAPPPPATGPPLLS